MLKIYRAGIRGPRIPNIVVKLSYLAYFVTYGQTGMGRYHGD